MAKPELTSNISDMIEAGTANAYTYANFSILQGIDNTSIRYAISNVIDDYMDEIKPILYTVQLTDDEFRRYKYKPWLMSLDIYQTVTLDFLILRLNNMISDTEFTKKTVKVIYPTDIGILQKIYNAEKKYIQQNRNSL